MSEPSPAAHITANTPLLPAIRAWEMYLLDQSRSPYTVKAFVGDLQLLAAHMPPDRPVGTITTKDLNQFLQWLQNGRGIPCSPKSLARRITSIKAFFRWLAQSGRISPDPAEKVLQQRLFENPKIEVIWNAAIDEVLGSPGIPPSVTGVRIRDTVTGTTRDVACDGFFVAIGHSPAVEVFEGQLKLKPSGYLWVEPGTARTSIPGVVAGGAVCDDVYRQAVTAAGMGCMAALEAEKYLAGHGA